MSGPGRAEVEVTRGVPYGTGLVGAASGARPVVLRMDVYRPPGATSGLRPAVVLAFGGAFHRGSKEDDTVMDGAMSNTSIAAWCAWLATRGHVACSIDYRLVQDDPPAGATPVVADPGAIPRSRVDVVRGILGLPPATDDMLWRGIEAASDDMATAFGFVVEHSAAWGIDPRRIAVGGFSAGARTALNAAYGEGVAAGAVMSLSGYMDPVDLARHLERRDPVPVLLVSGADDLDYIAARTPEMVRLFRAAGVPCVRADVPGAGHFYPADAPAVWTDGVVEGAGTVQDGVLAFLGRHLGRPAA